MENFSLSKYYKLILKNLRILKLSMLMALVVSVVVCLAFYRNTYESSAKILIKNKPQISLASEYNPQSDDYLPGANKNPVLTQMEILSSADIAKDVIKRMNKENLLNNYPPDKMVKYMKKRLKLKNPPGTDVIIVTVSWKNAQDAQKIAQAYVDAYCDYNTQINQNAVLQTQDYLKKQLADSNQQLADVRAKIKDYREKNDSVDIDIEAKSLIEQISRVEDAITMTNSQLAAENGKANALKSKVGMNTKKAIENVAVGQDSGITDLQKNLNDAQQRYATLNAKYPETNIQMQALSDNIAQIKKQLNARMLSTVGKTLSGKNSTISDPLRMKMVEDLVVSQTNVNAYSSQRSGLESSLRELKARKDNLPKKQKELQELIQEESILAGQVETLDTKFIEAQIKKSEIVSGVNVVENPVYPINASFPTWWQLILIFELIGFLFGILVILAVYYIEDICQGAEELEELVEAPVLGIIPWINNDSYKKNIVSENQNSVINIAYQRIITTLKVKACKKNVNAIAFSSAELEKKRSVISVNVAKHLSKSNNSVILIDSDYRDACIEEEFGIKAQLNQDLTSLLIKLQTLMNRGQNDEIPALISSAIVQVPGYVNLFIIPNSMTMGNPYEIITTPAFKVLIENLKTRFNFVFVDTPPLLAVPDAISVSQNLDGLVLLSGIRTSRSNLRKINKLCKDNYVEVLGSIARDTTTEDEVPESHYVKQLLADERDFAEVTEGQI